MSDLKAYFTKKIIKHKERMTDYSLDFNDRNYSLRAVRSYTIRLNKLNKGLI